MAKIKLPNIIFIFLCFVMIFSFIMGFNGCSPDTQVKYKGKIQAEIFNYDLYEETIVISFMLGDTQLFDELKDMEKKFFIILKNQDKVTFNVEITSPSTG